MSNSYSEQAAQRAAQQMIRQTAAALSGKTRGQDRQVHRRSYDVHDRRAKPWTKIGDGSAGAGIAFTEALVKTAEELSIEDAKRLRGLERAVREADDEAVRGRAFTELAAHRRRAIYRTDVFVLKALLQGMDFATGVLFPALATIAGRAGVSLRRVIYGLARLKDRGFVDWVRRSIATGYGGEFAPQREQTSNAYFFRHQNAMEEGVFKRFLYWLRSKRGRLTGKAPPPPTAPVRAPQVPSQADHPDVAKILAKGRRNWSANSSNASA